MYVLHTQGAMDPRAVEADEHSVGCRHPRRVFGTAVEARLCVCACLCVWGALKSKHDWFKRPSEANFVCHAGMTH